MDLQPYLVGVGTARSPLEPRGNATGAARRPPLSDGTCGTYQLVPLTAFARVDTQAVAATAEEPYHVPVFALSRR